MQIYQFTTQLKRNRGDRLCMGLVPELPADQTQPAALDKLYRNLRQVVELCQDGLTEGELTSLPEVVRLF